MTDKLPIVCAWCQRVKQADGSFREATHPPLVSHGICPDCEGLFRLRPMTVLR